MGYSPENYDRDCPLCGSETIVTRNGVSPSASARFRRCTGDDCNWSVQKGGTWTNTRWTRDEVAW